MFYDLITKKRNEWFAHADCPVLGLVQYISERNFMRDAQIEAIKTYLFLKIECKNKPLYDLFIEGQFNTLSASDIDELPLPSSVRDYFIENPAVVSLYEWAAATDETKKERSKTLADLLKTNPQSIDYKDFFKKIFYEVSYPDYLFSLPMGAGKTYLMAAFIYLDLYFAQNEMSNPAFAHNFIVLAPSGTKTSIIPSLRTIQNFNPADIIPEPAAGSLRRQLIFEVLDENKSAAKSNKIKNPNVQKIAVHQPLSALFGLVAVTNAEKVILDHLPKENGQGIMIEDNKDVKEKRANELRHLIGKIPNLGVFIDEVHHAESGDIKLRAVVNRWADESRNVNSVLGFSGTPYLESQEKINLIDAISIKTSEISSIVYYYPLSQAIGNFLKIPVVNIRTYTSEEIVREAVDSFLQEFGGRRYESEGTCPKIGIYCGTIENLEENIYPEVQALARKWEYDPDEIILKNHDGNKKYPEPANAKSEFALLDKPVSKIKIVLLVNIGKEGWSCRSLTAVILTQKSLCPKNMVLQTSCRCLREVTDARSEKAYIYLNDQNAEILQKQLEQQYNMNLDDFQKGRSAGQTCLDRFDRTSHLKLPPVDFYQLKVLYSANSTHTATDESIRSEIRAVSEKGRIAVPILQTARFTEKGLEIVNREMDDGEHGNMPADFEVWKYTICKGSFGFLSMNDLQPFDAELKSVFGKITFSDKKTGQTYFSSKYDEVSVESEIRKAFSNRREILTKEERVPETARLLAIKDGTDFTKISTGRPEKYFPNQITVKNIIKEDNGGVLIDEKTKAAIESLKASGNNDMAETLAARNQSFPLKDKTLHYLPFYADSSFESRFLNNVLTFDVIQKKGLEVYYNGDNNFTDFQIKCHKKSRNGTWSYIGRYTPDFLILRRNGDGRIDKVLIVETKGSIYAQDQRFQDKRQFTQNRFLELNTNMEYLYLQDTMTESEIQTATTNAVNELFN
jgi:hypothetical protein